MTQTLKEKNTWNEHFTPYLRDLDKKKPVIWMGDMNVAPTAKGRCLYTPCRFILTAPFKISQIRVRIGTKLLVTRWMKQRHSKTSSTPLILLPKAPPNLSMCGEIEIRTSSTIPISRTASIAV